MSKAQKITLIVATVLLVSGLGLSFAVLAMADFNLGNLSTTRDWVLTSDTLAPESEAAHIDIVVRDGSENVRIEPTSGKSIEIEYWENSNKSFATTDLDGVLTIEGSQEPTFGFMVMDLQDRTTVIKIPAEYAGSLTVQTASGNVAISDLTAIDELEASAMSGDVVLKNANAQSIELVTASGNVDAAKARCTRFSANSMSGNVSVETVDALDFSATAASGNVRISKVNAEEFVTTSTSGNVHAFDCFGSAMTLETASGNIDARVIGSESDFVIAASTASGSVHAPRGSADGEYAISMRTASGNIDLALTGAAAPNTSEDQGSTAPSAPEAPEAPKAPEAPNS